MPVQVAFFEWLFFLALHRDCPFSLEVDWNTSPPHLPGVSFSKIPKINDSLHPDLHPALASFTVLS